MEMLYRLVESTLIPFNSFDGVGQLALVGIGLLVASWVARWFSFEDMGVQHHKWPPLNQHLVPMWICAAGLGASALSNNISKTLAPLVLTGGCVVLGGYTAYKLYEGYTVHFIASQMALGLLSRLLAIGAGIVLGIALVHLLSWAIVLFLFGMFGKVFSGAVAAPSSSDLSLSSSNPFRYSTCGQCGHMGPHETANCSSCCSSL